MTAGFLYGAGAETLNFVTGTSGKYPKLFVSRQKNQSQLWIPRKPRKIGVWASGAEIQTSAVDTRTAVWVSTTEKFSKIFLGKTRNFSRKFRGVSAPALYKNAAVIQAKTRTMRKGKRGSELKFGRCGQQNGEMWMTGLQMAGLGCGPYFPSGNLQTLISQWPYLAWPPLQSLALQKKVQILGSEKLLEQCRREFFKRRERA